MRTIDALRAAFSLLLLLTMPRVASATSILLRPWQELVTKVDLVGVLECEVAGETVAKFRIVDSWKGPANGEVVTLSIPYLHSLREMNFNAPEIPLHAPLCGKRYLVMAYKRWPIQAAKSTKLFPIAWGPIPMARRGIPSDYSAEPFQGLLETDGATFFGAMLKAKDDSLPQFKRDVLELMNLPADKQEGRLLKMAAEMDLEREKRISVSQTKIESITNLQAKIANVDGAAEILEIVFSERASGKNPEYDQRSILSAGGKTTLATLERMQPKDLNYDDARWRESTIKTIRLGLGLERTALPDVPTRPQTKQEIDSLRALLDEPQPSDKAADAWTVLSTHDPEFVAEYLKRWSNDNSDSPNPYLGYLFASWFAQHCGSDRTKNLSTLLSARDVFVRCVGAVYLCFEDRELGMRKLEWLSQQDGDPGAWAALTRARRGDKSAMPRALEVFQTSGDSQHGTRSPLLSFHYNLQQRLRVLLSNSAKASGLAQPQHPRQFEHDGQQAKVYEYYLSWWNAMETKVGLSDPWLPTLEKQKVD